jgi:uncharacterized protein
MRTCRHLLVLLLLPALAGCGTDYHARRLITHNDLNDRFKEQVKTGGTEALLEKGTLAGHRRVPVADDVELDVWLLKADSDEPLGTVLLAHGLSESKVDLLGLAETLAAAGFDVVLPDLRAHGYSGGEYLTWGAKESADLKALADALLAENTLRPPILAVGFSMGAATALRYAASDPRVRGVLAVASYTDAPSVARWLTPLIDDEQYEQAWQRAGELAHFDPRQTSALAAVGNLRCPVVIVHGLLDKVVPYEQAVTLHHAAHEPKQLLPVKYAGHDLLATHRGLLVEQIVTIAGWRRPDKPPAETGTSDPPDDAPPAPDEITTIDPVDPPSTQPRPADLEPAVTEPSDAKSDDGHLAEIETVTVQPAYRQPSTRPASQPATQPSPEELRRHLPPWMQPG